MDPIKTELMRARGILDRMDTSVETYRAMDALWQCMYFMLMEASGMLGPQVSHEAQEKVAKALSEMVGESKAEKDGKPHHKGDKSYL